MGTANSSYKKEENGNKCALTGHNLDIMAGV